MTAQRSKRQTFVIFIFLWAFCEQCIDIEMSDSNCFGDILLTQKTIDGDKVSLGSVQGSLLTKEGQLAAKGGGVPIQHVGVVAQNPCEVNS